MFAKSSAFAKFLLSNANDVFPQQRQKAKGNKEGNPALDQVPHSLSAGRSKSTLRNSGSTPSKGLYIALQSFRQRPGLLSICGPNAFCYLLIILEILHLMVQEIFQKLDFKAKLKAKEYRFFATFLKNPDFFRNWSAVGLSRGAPQKSDFLWKEYAERICGKHKSFLNW